MCGIAGIIRFDDAAPQADRLAAMQAALANRGPDGQGVICPGSGAVAAQAAGSRGSEGPSGSAGGASSGMPTGSIGPIRTRCGMVHTRLAIIDLLSGHQPMSIDADGVGGVDAASDRRGPLHLCFNGEIYNHRELRRKLEQRGHRFRSDHSDTEVLLYGYRQWGDRLPKHVHGMFAFAIYDERDGSLFLCRDRAGKKPLFIEPAGEELLFASTLSALLAGRRWRRVCVDTDALITYLRFGYCFQRGLVDEALELSAGHWMRVSANGRIDAGRYWQPPPLSRHSTSMGAVEAVGEVLSESVSTRLESDVPLGCFLSGGIDSSLVAAVAQRRLGELGSDPLRTFNVRMDEAEYDETPHALAVARHIGSRHTTLEMPVGDLFADLERLMATCGEPTADSSILATYRLCRAARDHVRVALSGDGGDELFGGYDRYRAIAMLARWRKVIAGLPVPGAGWTSQKSWRARLGRLVYAARAGRSAARQYQRMIELFRPGQIKTLGLYTALEQQIDDDPAPPCPRWPTYEQPVDNAMRWDLDHYLPFELLRKVDRGSMAVALEVRCPLLDTQMLDLAGHLPAKVLMPGGRPKGLLRQLGVSMLPASILNRPKMGFALPMTRWLAGEAAQPLRERLLDGSLSEGLGMRSDTIERWCCEHADRRADHTHRLFGLLQLSIWVRWVRSRGLTLDIGHW